MKLLALDTSMSACSAALLDDTTVVAEDYAVMERGHAEALAPMVQRVMAGIPFSSLQRIAVTTGPGTFTGVRIGLSMARGLGLSLKIPVIGIDTLRAISANAQGDGPLLVVNDARKDDIYAALNGAVPAVMAMADCLALLPQGPVRVIGTAGDALIAASGRNDLIRIRTNDLPVAARFGAHCLYTQPEDAPPEPLYLRAPDAKPQALDLRLMSCGDEAAELLAELHRACFADGWDAAAFRKMLAMPATAMIAQAGSMPVGFILTRQAADEAEIITIGTHPSAQRRGVARALLDHQFTELRGRGAVQCFIEVAAENEAALALYASVGFTQEGLRRGYYANGDDAIVMRRMLT
ncbi:tRNA (adenosine(37)-N6)-threonylcarbamoyltransferase complex dimerization subunit type 1 TsaB [Aestuariivirga sp.]|uniref:tRNA (adenosine(37)-N6)-threonylcarbamoyltransferase complex dimerization subunit type 1 TsaB n=1 Tax=Aestuariivirga sp. TaxID=2650926 RepID=UPI0039E3A564